jgi:hypothetical protein
MVIRGIALSRAASFPLGVIPARNGSRIGANKPAV